MNYFLLEDVAALVERDGLPRVVRSRDELGNPSQHVMYYDGVARSMLAADWIVLHGAPPPDPTPEESAAGVAAIAQAASQATADAAQLRQQVLNLANSAVGVVVNALTAAQVRALVALLLLKAGALNTDGTVRPLTDWVDRPNNRAT
jgi:hypothetical protein